MSVSSAFILVAAALMLPACAAALFSALAERRRAPRGFAVILPGDTLKKPQMNADER